MMGDGACCHYCNSYECICLQLEHGRVVKPHGYTSALWESMSDEARQAALIVDENWVVKFRDMRGVAALRTKERDAALAALAEARAEVERLRTELTETSNHLESHIICWDAAMDEIKGMTVGDIDMSGNVVVDIIRTLRSDLDAARADAAAMREALASAADLAWDIETRQCKLDSTIVFGLGYDFYGLESCREEIHTSAGSSMVWPEGLGEKRKWSAYCEYAGAMWFSKFASKQEAKNTVIDHLATVIPDHPACIARKLLLADSPGAALLERHREQVAGLEARIAKLAEQNQKINSVLRRL